MTIEIGGEKASFKESFPGVTGINPNLILAQELQRRNLGVEINYPEINVRSAMRDDLVAQVEMTMEAMHIMHRIQATPELETLLTATGNRTNLQTLSRIDECDWDDETKKKVTAHYHSYRSQLALDDYSRARDPEVAEFAMSKRWEHHRVAEEELGGLPALTHNSDNAVKIIRRVVDRVMFDHK